jgi:hypothetical protein
VNWLRTALAAVRAQVTELLGSFSQPDQRKQWLLVVSRTGLLLACYAALREPFFEVTKLPEGSYRRVSVLFGALGNKEILALVLIGCGAPLLRFKRTSWASLDSNFSVRILVLACVVTLAWAMSCYDYNWYFNTWHVYDRLLLIALAALSFFHPAFVAPLVTLTAVMTYQFDHPMGQYSWTDKWLPFNVLLLFSVMLVARSVFRIGNRTFLLLALCIHAQSYFQPALLKLDLDWLSTNHLYHLFIATHVNGWLPDASDQTITQIARMMDWVNPLMLVGTITIELTSALTLIGTRFAKFIFVGCTLLHTGIFLSSGIFFWKWIIANAALFAVVARLPPAPARVLFGLQSRYFWVALLVLGLFPRVFDSKLLGWIDSPLNNLYRIEAVSDDQHVSILGPDYFSPYDMRIAQNRFGYLVKEAHIQGTFGAVDDSKIVKALDKVREPKQALEVDKRLGEKRYSEKRGRDFDKFIRTFIRNRQAAGGEGKSLGLLAAPHHIYLWAPAADSNTSNDVKQVQVRWLTTWLEGYHEVVLRDKIVRTVEIP